MGSNPAGCAIFRSFGPVTTARMSPSRCRQQHPDSRKKKPSPEWSSVMRYAQHLCRAVLLTLCSKGANLPFTAHAKFPRVTHRPPATADGRACVPARMRSGGSIER